MSNLETYAESELRRAGWFDEDGFYGSMMGEAVMKMIRIFSEEGHSGMSASLAINLFKTVAMFEPLTPLTGDDDEWTLLDYGDHMMWQNNRCSRVFKDSAGLSYDSEGIIFREPDGSCFTSIDSSVYITFPYTPKREYVDIEERV